MSALFSITTKNTLTAVDQLSDLKVLLTNQQAMAAATTTVIKTSGQISNDIATSAEKTKDNLKKEFGDKLTPQEQQTYNALTPTQQESILLNKADDATLAAYNEAQTTLSHWGVGGDYSRALSAVTQIGVGSTAGQGTTQLASNAVAPYAAELIGNTFAHTENPNEAAQLLSHAVLGGVLAYVNGGNTASGAVAGAGAEAAALSIAKELYPNAFVNGVLDRSKLTEEQANGIVALSSAVGALIGGISGGGITGATIDANVAQNAVENNYLNSYERNALTKATQDCNNGNSEACKSRDELKKIDELRDMSYKAAYEQCHEAGKCQYLKNIDTMMSDTLDWKGVLSKTYESNGDAGAVSAKYIDGK